MRIINEDQETAVLNRPLSNALMGGDRRTYSDHLDELKVRDHKRTPFDEDSISLLLEKGQSADSKVTLNLPQLNPNLHPGPVRT